MRLPALLTAERKSLFVGKGISTITIIILMEEIYRKKNRRLKWKEKELIMKT